ncbi:hypothetical protein ARAF_0676 [Arsenophonus endosymbiont of Aleurodicus floccissimus]|nr:hypothetical protein ARAF_0676 [Arsenophonus endosymbiont of Aleurodicus floccissimus]
MFMSAGGIKLVKSFTLLPIHNILPGKIKLIRSKPRAWKTFPPLFSIIRPLSDSVYCYFVPFCKFTGFDKRGFIHRIFSFITGKRLPFGMGSLSGVNSGGIMVISSRLILQCVEEEYPKINDKCRHYHNADNQ